MLFDGGRDVNPCLDRQRGSDIMTIGTQVLMLLNRHYAAAIVNLVYIGHEVHICDWISKGTPFLIFDHFVSLQPILTIKLTSELHDQPRISDCTFQQMT